MRANHQHALSNGQDPREVRNRKAPGMAKSKIVELPTDAIVEELIRRASEGCEGPMDDPCCTREKLPRHLWCDPCRCNVAAKRIEELRALYEANHG